MIDQCTCKPLLSSWWVAQSAAPALLAVCQRRPRRVALTKG
jgi:hypothetical protein